MQRIIHHILLLCACACVCACTQQSAMPKYNSRAQYKLDSIVSHYYIASGREFNELALDEMFNDYHSALKDLFNTHSIQGWQAKLQSLKSSDISVNGVQYKHITFDLINGLNCPPKITFNASYYTKNESLQNDSIYRKLKSIGNLQDVIFSGEIVRGQNGSVLTVYESLGTSYLMTYPTFNITITNISAQ